VTILVESRFFAAFKEKVKADRLGLVRKSGVREAVAAVGGYRVNAALETLAEIRERTAASVASLPRETMNLDNPVLVPVEISAALELIEQTQARNEPHRR